MSATIDKVSSNSLSVPSSDNLPPEVVAAERRLSQLVREIEEMGAKVYPKLEGRPLTRDLFDEVISPVAARVDAAVAEMDALRPELARAGQERGWQQEVYDHISKLWHDIVAGQVDVLRLRLSQWQWCVTGMAKDVPFVPAVLLPPFLLGSIVRRAVELSEARERGVVIGERWSPPELASKKVTKQERDGLVRIVGNLISNAVKYANPSLPSGERRVDVGASLEGSSVVFEVVDNGRGMSAEALTHYGNPGWRDPTVVEAGIRGEGVGASSIRGLVRILGGRFQISSELGQWTSAVVSIPLADLEGAKMAQETAMKPRRRKA